jgi:hypothetical protein
MRAYPKTVPWIRFSRKKYHGKFGRPVIASASTRSTVAVIRIEPGSAAPLDPRGVAPHQNEKSPAPRGRPRYGNGAARAGG